MSILIQCQALPDIDFPIMCMCLIILWPPIIFRQTGIQGFHNA